MSEITTMNHAYTIGIDLGDKRHQVCIMQADGTIQMQGKIDNTKVALEAMFRGMDSSLIAMEAGTHSPWISALMEAWGHTVLVANPCELAAITHSKKKTDQRDARMLAKLARVDPELLHPLHHRSRATQIDFGLVKARRALVKARSMLICHCRGIVKSVGERLPSCSADVFAKRVSEAMPVELREALEPLVSQVGELTERIGLIEHKMEVMAQEKYPDSERLSQPGSVGPITVLAYMMLIENPHRFKTSRAVGPYVGLSGKSDQSGESNKQCRITKDGDEYVRMLLVQCAQHLLSRRGRDCELRRWGLKLCERGGKAAKKRAVIAVARKLAVQLHALWISGEDYDPFYAQKRRGGDGADAQATARAA